MQCLLIFESFSVKVSTTLSSLSHSLPIFVQMGTVDVRVCQIEVWHVGKALVRRWSQSRASWMESPPWVSLVPCD